MLACVSPADSQFAETRSTLEFAGRASAIVNKASKNEIETIGKYRRQHPYSIMFACGCASVCVCVRVSVCVSVYDICAIHMFVYLCCHVCVYCHVFYFCLLA